MLAQQVAFADSDIAPRKSNGVFCHESLASGETRSTMTMTSGGNGPQSFVRIDTSFSPG